MVFSVNTELRVRIFTVDNLSEKIPFQGCPMSIRLLPRGCLGGKRSALVKSSGSDA
jgi:hypothetical protein